MKAPEKIYVIEQEAARGTILLASAELNDFAEQNNAEEYIRADAFIEKACEFLSNEANIPLWEGYAYTFGCDTTKLVENFKNYMKGE